MPGSDNIDLVKKVHIEAINFDFKRHQLTMSGLADQAGIIETNALNPESVLNPHSKKAREKKKLQRWIHQMLLSILEWSSTRHIAELGKLTNWMIDKAEQFEEKAQEEIKMVEENISDLNDNSRFIEQANQVIESHEKHETVEKQQICELLESRDVTINKETPVSDLVRILKDEKNKVVKQSERLIEKITIHEENADKWIEKAEQYKNAAAKIEENVHSTKTDLENGKISEEESKEEFVKIWEHIPREILKEYEKDHGQSEYTAQIKQTQAFLKAEEPNGDSKLEKIKGTLTSNFNNKSPGIVLVLEEVRSLNQDFNPLDL